MRLPAPPLPVPRAHAHTSVIRGWGLVVCASLRCSFRSARRLAVGRSASAPAHAAAARSDPASCALLLCGSPHRLRASFAELCRCVRSLLSARLSDRLAACPPPHSFLVSVARLEHVLPRSFVMPSAACRNASSAWAPLGFRGVGFVLAVLLAVAVDVSPAAVLAVHLAAAAVALAVGRVVLAAVFPAGTLSAGAAAPSVVDPRPCMRGPRRRSPNARSSSFPSLSCSSSARRRRRSPTSSRRACRASLTPASSSTRSCVRRSPLRVLRVLPLLGRSRPCTPHCASFPSSSGGRFSRVSFSPVRSSLRRLSSPVSSHCRCPRSARCFGCAFSAASPASRLVLPPRCSKPPVCTRSAAASSPLWPVARSPSRYPLPPSAACTPLRLSSSPRAACSSSGRRASRDSASVSIRALYRCCVRRDFLLQFVGSRCFVPAVVRACLRPASQVASRSPRCVSSAAVLGALFRRPERPRGRVLRVLAAYCRNVGPAPLPHGGSGIPCGASYRRVASSFRAVFRRLSGAPSTVPADCSRRLPGRVFLQRLSPGSGASSRPSVSVSSGRVPRRCVPHFCARVFLFRRCLLIRFPGAVVSRASAASSLADRVERCGCFQRPSVSSPAPCSVSVATALAAPSSRLADPLSRLGDPLRRLADPLSRLAWPILRVRFSACRWPSSAHPLG